MRILDATAGWRSIWYESSNPFTVFMDRRNGEYSNHTENLNPLHERIVTVHPDVIAEWQHTPFKDGVFDMVIWDPPQIFKNEGQILPGMALKYGVLFNHNWRGVMQDGARELFRVLKDNGILIFKWSDCSRSVKDILKLIPYAPLFGTRTGQSNKTHWITFIKHREGVRLDDYESDNSPALKGGASCEKR